MRILGIGSPRKRGVLLLAETLSVQSLELGIVDFEYDGNRRVTWLVGDISQMLEK